MAREFTAGQVASLLSPSWKSVYNERTRSGRGDFLRIALFVGLTLGFGLFVFAGTYRMLLYLSRFSEFTAPLTHQILGTVSTFTLTILFASTIVTALSTQYLSDDLTLLASSPTPLPALYGARLILTTVQASWMVVLFSVPLYAAFAVSAEAPWHFLFAVALTLPPLIVIAAGFGSMVTMTLMAVFPARRVREMLVLLGAVFVVLLVFIIRVQKPERLLNPSSIYDIAEFFAAFQTPTSPFLPSSWATTLLIAGRRAEPLATLPLALLWSSAAAAVILGCWLARRVYRQGYSRAQESRPAKLSTLPFVDTFLERVSRPLGLRFRSLLLKDIRTFVRDTTQWSQVLLLLALIVVYLYNFSVLPENFTFATFFLQNLFSFLNLGLAGFVLAAVAVRFVFTSVSAEGRAFWIVRVSPLTTREFLWSKFWTAIPPLIVLSQILTISSNHFLGATTFMTVLSSATIFLVTFAIVGLGVGIGAAMPRFKHENITQIAGSSGGLLYMITASTFVATVLAIEAFPVYFYLNAQYRGTPLSSQTTMVIVASLGLVALLNALAVWLPMRWGAKRLEAMEI